MKNNKILLILCLIILIFSLNALSATTENNTNTKKAEKIYEHDNHKQAQEDIYVNINSQSSTEDGSKSNPYKTINKENLEKITPYSTLHVAKGKYTLGSVNITKDITIIGENREDVIFTSNGESSMFTLPLGRTLKLNNITIKDHTSTGNAAITNNGNLILTNILFQNNTGTMGGSISNNGNLQVNNTVFMENTASFGSAIYNKANLTIKNSTFNDNHIYNVGGAIYSTNGTMEVTDSYFSNNRAVSGAAIYNAFGYLEVNNTKFIENDAEHFFGGAIYSTGITRAYNSLFDNNQANKDGGAITTTSNFTIINCTFNENFAKENGGAIENVPWTDKENGNLTIINSTFTENAATLGGAIINYGKIEHTGIPATVTARGCVFDSNTADKGGVIYSQQYVNIQNSVFKDNTADEYDVIYVNDSEYVISLDNNWWSTNNPRESEIGFMPSVWVVMKFTNKTSLYVNKTSTVSVSLNTLNDGSMIKTTLPPRKVIFNAINSTFKENNMTIKGSIENVVEQKDDNITAQIDNQILTLQPVNAPKPTILTINTNKQAYYKDNIKVTGKFMDINKKPLINTLLKLTINNKTRNVKTNNKGIYTYNLKALTTGINNVSISYHGNNKYEANKTSTQFKVNKKNIKITLNTIKTVNYKDNITIKGKFTDTSNHPLQNSNIQLKINNKNVIIKTNNKGIFNYTFKAIKTGKNSVTATYNGNKYYMKNTTSTTFTVTKKQVQIILNSIKTVNFKEKTRISGKFMDKNNHTLTNTIIKLNISGKIINVKTDKKGIFTYNYKTNKTGTNTVTAVFKGNNNYSKFSITRKFNVKKQDLKITVNKIVKTKLGQNVKISGKLTDKNAHALQNTLIKIKVNNKNYLAKTNRYGIFNCNIKTSRAGLNNLTVSHNGNINYNKYVLDTVFRVSV
ncbi:Ig-like domain repeat protein [Methanosphaera sp. ISO3-F5]|uniref:carboxypeptidase-like regulatory domain-containing protein n=1 Tax=Methanosphaera sp. ISO3-F5 TaxID=1452353 RepID=UPI002B261528|nr:Ig-like domain repeat protein [Methanosphaera sp. ISO3-F5]WQH64229.1 Ig-like domain repeat protein [Methanosphaera sp. ISO3-F5]